jgi:hypothetical protein
MKSGCDTNASFCQQQLDALVSALERATAQAAMALGEVETVRALRVLSGVLGKHADGFADLENSSLRTYDTRADRLVRAVLQGIYAATERLSDSLTATEVLSILT